MIDYRLLSGWPVNRHGAWSGLKKTTLFSRLSRGARSVLPKNRNSALISMPTRYRVHRLSHLFVEMAHGEFYNYNHNYTKTNTITTNKL